MELVINKINLDVMKSGIQATVNCKEGDILTRVVIASFRSNGQTYKVPDDVTAVIRAKKPDGTVIYNNAVVQDGKVQFIFTSQYCAVAGKYTGEIQLLKEGQVLYTPKFCIAVEENIYSDSEIESTNEYTQLTESIENAEEALQIAQNLHLIEYVNNLDSPGDDKYLYVLEETAPYFTLTDFPTTVSCGIIFESTDDTYPLLLFTGMVLQEKAYEDPDVIQFRSFINPSAVGEYTSMFGYDVANEKWVELYQFDYYGESALSQGDEIILTDGDMIQGTPDPVITDYIVKKNPKYNIARGLVYLYDNSQAVTTIFHYFTNTGNVGYGADDNVIDLDNIPELLVGEVATPYVYDETLNRYVSLADTSLRDRVTVLEDKMTAAEHAIAAAESDIDDIEDELDFTIELYYNSNNDTKSINHTFADIQTALTDYSYIPVLLTYKDGTPNLRYAEGYITANGTSSSIAFIFNVSTTSKLKTYQFGLTSNNTLSLTIASKDVQDKLTAGNNIIIDSNNVISAVGGGGSASNPIYYKENNILKCTMTYAEVLYFIQHQNELFRPQLKMSTLSIYDFYFVDTYDDYIWIIFKGSISGDSPSQETGFYIIKHYSDETISQVSFYETSYQKKIYQLSNNSGIILVNQGISDAIAVRIKSNNGIDVDNQGIYAKLKSNGGITVDSNGLFVDQNLIQAKLIAGDNITIENNVISAENETYTAGEGIDIDANNAISLKITDEAVGGSIVSFNNAGENLPLKSCIVNIESVQSGSGDPSPSNVRPITGWTECNLTRTGKNLFNVNDIASVDTNGNSTMRNGVIVKNIQGNFIISGVQTDSSYVYARVKNGTTYGNVIYLSQGSPTTISQTITLNENDELIIYDGSSVASMDSSKARLSIIQIEKGSTATTYEAYKGNTYNIEFPSQAGTVYGGTLDVTNGVLTVTDGYIASYNGETLPSTWISSMDVYAEGTTPTNGAEVVYKLATPQTYNVTPTEIKTLLGINNIFADCGDVKTPVTYYTEAGEDILYLALHGIPAAEGSEF